MSRNNQSNQCHISEYPLYFCLWFYLEERYRVFKKHKIDIKINTDGLILNQQNIGSNGMESLTQVIEYIRKKYRQYGIMSIQSDEQKKLFEEKQIKQGKKILEIYDLQKLRMQKMQLNCIFNKVNIKTLYLLSYRKKYEQQIKLIKLSKSYTQTLYIDYPFHLFLIQLLKIKTKLEKKYDCKIQNPSESVFLISGKQKNVVDICVQQIKNLKKKYKIQIVLSKMKENTSQDNDLIQKLKKVCNQLKIACLYAQKIELIENKVLKTRSDILINYISKLKKQWGNIFFCLIASQQQITYFTIQKTRLFPQIQKNKQNHNYILNQIPSKPIEPFLIYQEDIKHHKNHNTLPNKLYYHPNHQYTYQNQSNIYQNNNYLSGKHHNFTKNTQIQLKQNIKEQKNHYKNQNLQLKHNKIRIKQLLYYAIKKFQRFRQKLNQISKNYSCFINTFYQPESHSYFLSFQIPESKKNIYPQMNFFFKDIYIYSICGKIMSRNQLNINIDNLDEHMNNILNDSNKKFNNTVMSNIILQNSSGQNEICISFKILLQYEDTLIGKITQLEREFGNYFGNNCKVILFNKKSQNERIKIEKYDQ